MKVFLLRIDDRRHAFFAPAPEVLATADEPPDDRSWSGALARRARRAQASIERGPGWAARGTPPVWDWLQRFVAPDEPLLRGLRHVDSVSLHHPATMDPQAAATAWRAYLAGRRRHHLFWASVDLLLGPLAVLVLTPLPGPNVIGYWFVYRAACHAAALIGVRRAGHRAVRTVLEPTEALDAPLAGADRGARDALSRGCGLDGLDVFLVRIGVTPPDDPEAPGPEADPSAPGGATGRCES